MRDHRPGDKDRPSIKRADHPAGRSDGMLAERLKRSHRWQNMQQDRLHKDCRGPGFFSVARPICGPVRAPHELWLFHISPARVQRSLPQTKHWASICVEQSLFAPHFIHPAIAEMAMLKSMQLENSICIVSLPPRCRAA